MKYKYLIIVCVVTFANCKSFSENFSIATFKEVENINVIPDRPSATPNYYCTWRAQNQLAKTDETAAAFGLSGHAQSAIMLTEENFLSDTGILSRIYPDIRKDLYVVYDVGWDVPASVNKNMETWKSCLGSLIVADDKFPSISGGPVQRLLMLDSITKSFGWKGAGLWIHAQQARHFYKVDPKTNKEYFTERLKWMNKAGIDYWKVDYGQYCIDLEFREMLSDLGKRYAPDLLIEHARNGAPLNDYFAPYEPASFTETGTFAAWDEGKVLKTSLETMAFSDVFRTYDVSYVLNIPTTLDRVATLLKHAGGDERYNCMLNCESEPVIAAVLGCALGIMDVELDEVMLNDFVSAIHWHKIAPPWEAGKAITHTDTSLLTDSWMYKYGMDWINWFDSTKTIYQKAPATVGRGIDLPVVHAEKDAPYVIASKHPIGAVGIGTLPRTKPGQKHVEPLADVELKVGNTEHPIAVFGAYKSLTLTFDTNMDEKEFYVQDLYTKKAYQLFGDTIRIKKNTLTITHQAFLQLKKQGIRNFAIVIE